MGSPEQINTDNLSTDSILAQITQVLVRDFEVEESLISLDAKLMDDLDIDSIDAVDLLAELKDLTGRKVDPDDFKAVETLGDVIEVVQRMGG